MKPNIFSDKMSYFEWFMIFNAEKMSLGLGGDKKIHRKGWIPVAPPRLERGTI